MYMIGGEPLAIRKEDPSSGYMLYCGKSLSKRLKEDKIVDFSESQQEESLLKKSKKNNRNFGSKS